MIKGNHMTPLTKEAVEREIRLLENNASDCHVRTETVAMLRALSARVEELQNERDILSEYAFEATKAITGLTAGGSEFFAGTLTDGRYKADLDRCVKYVRETKETLYAQVKRQHERRRLQGLNKAKSAVKAITIPKEGWPDDRPGVWLSAIDEAEKAIEALKGEATND